jgi:hypothetical protein
MCTQYMYSPQFHLWYDGVHQKIMVRHCTKSAFVTQLKKQCSKLITLSGRWSAAFKSNGESISTSAQYVTPHSKICCEKVKMCWFSSGNWFFCTKFVQLARAGKRHNTVMHLQKRVINWTWLRLSIYDWLIIMIGPGGLLSVVLTYMQLVIDLLVGLPKKKQLNLDI